MQKQTQAVIANFAHINQGVVFKKGNVISTVSPLGDVYARAVVEEPFTRDFAIYDLNEFLSAMKLFDAPSIEYCERFAKISSGRNSIRYLYSSPSVIVSPPEGKDINLDDPSITMVLNDSQINEIVKAANVLKLSHVRFDKDGIRVLTDKMEGNFYECVPKEINVNEEISVSIKVENLNLLPGNYEVSVGESLVQFTGANVKYVIGVESE